jgi:hypothetical protein
LRCAGAAYAINPIAAMLPIIGSNRMKDDVSGLGTPQGIRFDNSDASASLFIDVVEFHAQAVGCGKADDFERRRTRQTRN